MNRSCASFWEGLVDLAEGKPHSDAASHAATCRLCSTKLGQLRTMLAASSLEVFYPPADLRERVMNLLPPRPRLRASLLRSTLTLSGARGSNQDFQIVAAAESHKVRLMFIRNDVNWSVHGQTPEGEWNVRRGSQVLQLDQSRRFSFDAEDLESTGLELTSEELTIEIPSAAELTKH